MRPELVTWVHGDGITFLVAATMVFTGMSPNPIQGYLVLERVDHPVEDPPVRGCTRGGARNLQRVQEREEPRKVHAREER